MNGITAYIVATAAVIAACTTACGPRNGKIAAAYAERSMTVTPAVMQHGTADTLRFGRMHQGETAVKSLRVENGCDRPIVALRHTTSCGCVTIGYNRRPIAPGASEIVRFEFDSRGEYGWQMKLVELYLADSDRPLKFYIEAEVE